MPSPVPYFLIASSNVARGAALRAIASEALAVEGIVVRDGDDALQEVARRGAPALLVIDLSLPRVDGFTVIRQVRRQATVHHCRIIVVSAHESLRTAARDLASTLGIAGVLPLDVERLVLREVIFAGLDPLREPARSIAPAHQEDAAARAKPLLDPEEVVDVAALDARRRFRVPVSIGYLRFGEQESRAFHVVSRGPDAPPAAGDTVDPALLRQVADSQEPLIIANVEGHPLFAHAGRAAGPIRGFAAVPIVSSREHVHAALCLLDVRPLALSAADIDALSAFARHAALDLDRATALVPDRPTASELPDDVKALQHLAATDPLTGLANRRGGERHITNEISRARREKRPLSCILLDIDRFKQVNDTFGHQAGDQVLRDLSALLRRTIRAYDILVRWGGEEFLLVLPGVSLTAARALADRLRSAVEMLDTHGIGPVTVSAGTAEFDADYDFGAALHTADRRLYEAKAAGRNCVV